MLRVQLANDARLEIVSRTTGKTPLTVAAVAFDPKDGYYHCWLAREEIVAGYTMFELVRGGRNEG